MTREEQANIDHERKKLDGKGDEVRSHVPSREFRRNWDLIKWREREEREERDDG